MITIAIDGYSSSGKSSMARQLAATIGYRYIDSGAMYRAVTLYALRHGWVADGGEGLNAEALTQALPEIHIDFTPAPAPGMPQRTLLNGDDVEDEIRTLRVSHSVSPVAAIPAVRRALVAMQRQMGREKGIVMDGRDIGTVVFPDAELKIFVTATAETRAQRRFLELQEKGMHVNYEEVLANVVQRDHIDETRSDSPLRQAPDALLLDNSHMTRAQQAQWLLDQYNRVAHGCD